MTGMKIGSKCCYLGADMDISQEQSVRTHTHTITETLAKLSKMVNVCDAHTHTHTYCEVSIFGCANCLCTGLYIWINAEKVEHRGIETEQCIQNNSKPKIENIKTIIIMDSTI